MEFVTGYNITLFSNTLTEINYLMTQMRKTAHDLRTVLTAGEQCE